ncbi:nucleoside hydrolase [Candidatus Sumerlaeota bacterium]|nr:nucleoside hydrolase [Candidatus Sumerlaeota bacterium]
MNFKTGEMRLVLWKAMTFFLSASMLFFTGCATIKNKGNIILDTDIGPDCDDAGALGILNALADAGEAEIIAVGHCTSSLWGAPCIDVINRYYGRNRIPIGTLNKKGFLDDEQYASYNKPVSLKFPNRFASAPQSVPDAVDAYREALSQAADKSVTLAAIGPLPNLARLLDSPPDAFSSMNGRELVSAKASKLVIMGGSFPKQSPSPPSKEWNFEMDPVSAAHVVNISPIPIYFTGFQVGAVILTGGRLVAEGSPDNPVRECYRLYPHTDKGRRMSWDLTAVHFAVRGESPLWRIEGPGIVSVGSQGESSWIENPKGSHYLIRANAEPREIAEELESLLLRTPARK